MNTAPLPDHRPPGTRWIGDPPKDFRIVPLATVATVVNGYPFDAASFSATTGHPLVRIRDIGSTETETLFDGEFLDAAAITSDDLLVGMDGEFNVGRWKGEGQALLNQRVCCIRGVTHEVTRFLEYVLPQPLGAINAVTYSTTVKHLSSAEVKKIRVPMPVVADDLTRIVSYLDRETAKIDALVEEQRRLIELLKEKRQAVISHAVTKGLDPNAKMKPSGVEWMGDVPEHWETTRIKWVAKMESGHTPDKKVEAYWENCDIPWVSLHDTGFLRDNDFITDTAQQINELGIANSSARLLPGEAVVFSRDATIGRCAITTRPMAVSQHFIAWVCGSKVLPEFLLRCLRSMSQELDRLTFGATVKTIGMPDVRNLTIALPSTSEQLEIIRHVRDHCSRIDQLIKAAGTIVDLLLERRSALISAAVTGKIDVRNHQHANEVAA